MYSVKITNIKGEVSWAVLGDRYTFTKSKSEFIKECAIRKGLYPNCSLDVVKNN